MNSVPIIYKVNSYFPVCLLHKLIGWSPKEAIHYLFLCFVAVAPDDSIHAKHHVAS